MKVRKRDKAGERWRGREVDEKRNEREIKGVDRQDERDGERGLRNAEGFETDEKMALESDINR